MKIYHRNESGFGKWVVAAVAFLVVMTISFADVYGITVPSKPGDVNGKDPKPYTGKQYNQTDTERRGMDPEPCPTPTPEPGTMILMGLGLGAAAVARKLKSSN